MGLFAENLRYLLWRQGVPDDSWSEHVARWADCEPERAIRLLQGLSQPTPDELLRIAQATDMPDDELQFARLLDDSTVNILQANLAYLRAGLPRRGDQRPLARVLQVSEGTLSRWFNGAQEPEQRHIDALSEALGVDAKVNLRTDPLFLSPSPATDTRRRTWLGHQLKRLDRTTLRELFPALERLLRD